MAKIICRTGKAAILMVSFIMTGILTIPGHNAALGADCPDYCPTCVDRSHDFECVPWWRGPAKTISVSNYGADDTITVTVGGCDKDRGDVGTAWAFVQDAGECGKDCGPCDEPNQTVRDCADGYHYYIVVKVEGDRDKFKDLVDNVTFIVEYPDEDGYKSVVVKEANCEYSVASRSFVFYPIDYPDGVPVDISVAAANSGTCSSGASFTYTIDWYLKRNSLSACELDYDFWHKFESVSGNIEIKINPRNDFDPFGFQPDVKDGSEIAWVDAINRIYIDPKAKDLYGNYLYDSTVISFIRPQTCF